MSIYTTLPILLGTTLGSTCLGGGVWASATSGACDEQPFRAHLGVCPVSACMHQAPFITFIITTLGTWRLEQRWHKLTPRRWRVHLSGRHFAKQEIVLTIAKLVSRFDFEFLGWTEPGSGKPSHRPAQNDRRFTGGASVPPDREMQVLLKRRS